MNQSERISKDHEECLARLPAEQRQTVLGETARLLTRLRLATAIPVGDGDLVERLKSQPNGSRIARFERKKG